MKRTKHIGLEKVVIGISGGLDSTLALLICVNAYKHLNKPLENIIAITMPGFGTTNRTYTNAVTLIKELGVTFREISIKDACIQHFKDIGHPGDVYDITYENTQARERTQILMDIANQNGAIVIGTGNLSEIALGWCTYNADHMSMYAVNCSVPKTLVKNMIDWIKDHLDGITEEAKTTLVDILNTEISPELLPADENGNIAQKTESVIGDYILHDFFMYYVVRHGYAPKKLMLFAEKAFENIYDREEIKRCMKIFYRRFFNNQFKRSCIPDGPKVGSVSLSPRGDWRMPSDASSKMWLKEVEEL